MNKDWIVKFYGKGPVVNMEWTHDEVFRFVKDNLRKNGPNRMDIDNFNLVLRVFFAEGD